MSGLIETPDTPDESMSSERLESEDSQRMTGSAENKPDRRPRGCPVKRPMPLTPFPRDTLENRRAYPRAYPDDHTAPGMDIRGRRGEVKLTGMHVAVGILAAGIDPGPVGASSRRGKIPLANGAGGLGLTTTRSSPFQAKDMSASLPVNIRLIS